jgi:hypothetical protein
MRLSLGLLAFGLITLDAPDARACGGCFIGPSESTVVTDHRMAFAVSKTQTVLWDQIRYNGDPASFAWVLPVRGDAKVELSSDDWFAALDASTQPVIQSPSPSCPQGGCNRALSASFADNASATPGGGNVEVVRQEVVGPYETVVLRSTDATALQTWLDKNGFVVPEAVRPTVAAHVAERFDFVALRLQPGKGVRAMQPVRIVTQGAVATLPLRMVAAGVGPQVGITLYVIGEGRYETQNFPNALLERERLLWDSKQTRSNYQELSIETMAREGGRTWLTESAQRAELTYTGRFNPDSTSRGFGFPITPGLADVYLAKCKREIACEAGATFGDAESDGGACDPCAAFDDLDVATRGMDTSRVHVSRLRAFLPASSLSTDLRLQASARQEPVSNVYIVRSFADPDESECDDNEGGCATSRRRSTGAGIAALAVLGAKIVAAIRRRRRA